MSSSSRAPNRLTVKIDRLVPLSKCSKTTLRCSCGKVKTIDTDKLMMYGWQCKCGFKIPPRGNVFAREGRSAMRSIEYANDRRKKSTNDAHTRCESEEDNL